MSRETINDPRIMNHKKISSINTQIETTGFVQLSSYSTDNCNGVPEIYSWRLGSCHPNGENSISYSQIHIDDHHETVSLLELKYSDHKCLHYLSERFINVTSGNNKISFFTNRILMNLWIELIIPRTVIKEFFAFIVYH
jgi:hypothetical protein